MSHDKNNQITQGLRASGMKLPLITENILCLLCASLAYVFNYQTLLFRVLFQ